MEEQAAGFAKRLRGLKGDRTVKELAARWSIPATTIQSWLTRGTMPTMPQLDKVARAAGVSVQWLATGLGSMARDDLERSIDLAAIAARHAKGLSDELGFNGDEGARLLQSQLMQLLNASFVGGTSASTAPVAHMVRQDRPVYDVGPTLGIRVDIEKITRISDTLDALFAEVALDKKRHRPFRNVLFSVMERDTISRFSLVQLAQWYCDEVVNATADA